jgi:LysR family transcriptional regulator, cyn operon transcriptional activator
MQACYGFDMNLRHVRTLVTIADAGGVARAASRLNLSQPALSRQIHALEQALGVKLFDRVGRRVRLTGEGEDLLDRGRRLLQDADGMVERARALKSGHTGILRVGATPQAIENSLADFLPRFRARHGGIEVRLVEDGGARLPARLERGDVHLAHMPAGDERYQGRLLYPIHVVAAFPPGHRLGRRASIEVAALAEERLLVLHREFGSRTWFEAACNVAHVRPHVVLESAAPHTLIALAAAGYGIAILPSNARLNGDVRSVPLVYRGASVGRWVMIGWDPQRFLPAYARLFVEELVAHTGRHCPGRALIRRAPPLPQPRERAE